MPFEKGRKKVGGRKKGTPDKATNQAREAIAKFVDRNTSRLEGWLDDIALENPKDAFDCVTKIMEYHVPKLARTEHTGEDGKAIDHNITVQFVTTEKGEE